MAEPYCLAMVLCDGFHQDPATGKNTILGSFSTITAKEFPSFVQFIVYFAVTDGQGKIKFQIQVVSSDYQFEHEGDEGKIFSVSTEVELPSPLAVFDYALGVKFPMSHPGVYHCELLADDKLLMSRRVLVTKAIESDKNE